MTNKYMINFTRGDTYALDVRFKNITEELSEALFTVKENPEGEVLLQASLLKGISLVDDRPYKNEKTYKIQLESDETANLVPSVKYIYDFRVSVGNVVQTILSGVLVVSDNVSDVHGGLNNEGIEVIIADEIDSDFSVSKVLCYEKITKLTDEDLDALYGEDKIGWYYADGDFTCANVPVPKTYLSDDGNATISRYYGFSLRVESIGNYKVAGSNHPCIIYRQTWYSDSTQVYSRVNSLNHNGSYYYINGWHHWEKLTPNKGALTIKQNGEELCTFSANADTNKEIDIKTPTVEDGRVTLQKGGVDIGTFSANQSDSTTINFDDSTHSYKTIGVDTDLDTIYGLDKVGWYIAEYNHSCTHTPGVSGSFNLEVIAKGDGTYIQKVYATRKTLGTYTSQDYDIYVRFQYEPDRQLWHPWQTLATIDDVPTIVNATGELSLPLTEYITARKTLQGGKPVFCKIQGSQSDAWSISPMNLIIESEGEPKGLFCQLPHVLGATSIQFVFYYSDQRVGEEGYEEIEPTLKEISFKESKCRELTNEDLDKLHGEEYIGDYYATEDHTCSHIAYHSGTAFGLEVRKVGESRGGLEHYCQEYTYPAKDGKIFCRFSYFEASDGQWNLKWGEWKEIL